VSRLSSARLCERQIAAPRRGRCPRTNRFPPGIHGPQGLVPYRGDDVWEVDFVRTVFELARLRSRRRLLGSKGGGGLQVFEILEDLVESKSSKSPSISIGSGKPWRQVATSCALATHCPTLSTNPLARAALRYSGGPHQRFAMFQAGCRSPDPVVRGQMLPRRCRRSRGRVGRS